MRPDLEEKNAVRLDDAKCGCERYEVDTQDATGKPMRGRVCLHVDGCHGVVDGKAVKGKAK